MKAARVLVGVIVLAACSALGQAAVSKRPPTPPPGDAELERAIRERFARSKAAGDGFTVRVQGGVATIDGKTGVMQHKGAATRMARSAGAKRVVNRIQISEAARQKASANLSKGRRRAQLRRAEVQVRSEQPRNR